MLEFLDEEGAPVEGAGLFCHVHDELSLSDSEGRVRLPAHESMIFEVAARGYGGLELLDDPDARSFVLHPCPWVELTLPDFVELPEPPLYLCVGLGQGNRVERTAGADVRGPITDLYFRFGPTRRVEIAVDRPGRFGVTWCVTRVQEHGFQTISGAQGPDTVLVPAETPHVSAEVIPVATKIDEMLRDIRD